MHLSQWLVSLAWNVHCMTAQKSSSYHHFQNQSILGIAGSVVCCEEVWGEEVWVEERTNQARCCPHCQNQSILGIAGSVVCCDVCL